MRSPAPDICAGAMGRWVMLAVKVWKTHPLSTSFGPRRLPVSFFFFGARRLAKRDIEDRLEICGPAPLQV